MPLPPSSLARNFTSKVSGIITQLLKPAPTTGLGRAMRKAVHGGVSPRDAATNIRNVANRDYSLNNWVMPSQTTLQSLVDRRSEHFPDLHTLNQGIAEARLRLDRLDPGPLLTALSEEVEDISARTNVAEAHWMARLHLAAQSKDPLEAAMASCILGENHESVRLHVGADLGERPKATAATNTIAPPRSREFTLADAVAHEQNLESLLRIANARYQYDAVLCYTTDYSRMLTSRMGENFASISDARADIETARTKASGIRDPELREATLKFLAKMEATLRNAEAYWRSVLSRPNLARSPGLEALACSWLGKNGSDVIKHRLPQGHDRSDAAATPGAVDWVTLSSTPSHTLSARTECFTSPSADRTLIPKPGEHLAHQVEEHVAGELAIAFHEARYTDDEFIEERAFDFTAPVTENAPASVVPGSHRVRMFQPLEDPSLMALVKARTARSGPFDAFRQSMLHQASVAIY
jgi:hypothetical protein